LSIVLYRVDERLLHGQVVLGWGGQLSPDRFIVVDDDLATSSWEQDLYRLAIGDADALFVGLDQARAELAGWRADSRKSVLLARNVATMRALARGGLLSGEKLNLGGLHHGPGRTEVLTYLHLTEEDRRDLRDMEEEGMDVSARDLPDAHKVPLKALLES
jgi:PTS system mannose-specific IIB component/fructoselysine and glucoselysine-specific PTS system IIB component